MAITFTSNKNSRNTVGKLLDSVLPGNLSSTDSKSKIKLSTSQIINKQQTKIDPEKLRRIQKKEKLNKRKQVRKNNDLRDSVESKAKFEVLQKHLKDGTITKEESKELNKIIKKNIVNLESWKSDDIEEDLIQVQRDILELKDTKISKSKRKSAKIQAKELYEKKKEHRYPGLTPGLAPVGMEDSDEDEF